MRQLVHIVILGEGRLSLAYAFERAVRGDVVDEALL